MTTPDTLYGVKRSDWVRYELLRRSVARNMQGSRETLGLSQDEFTSIQENFWKMREAWGHTVPKKD